VSSREEELVSRFRLISEEHRRPRLLFMAESVTMAQVVRLRALAGGLDEASYDVHFACSEFDPVAFAGTRFTRWPISSVDKRQALRNVERGERLYDAEALTHYVEEELELFRRVEPALVIGDFRLSLSVSARLAMIPYAALINAYWSPYLVRRSFPVPDHPIVNLIGAERAARYLPQALAIAFRRFVAPINSVREHYGLKPLEGLLEVLTDADFTLYPDIPELYPTQGLPPSHRFLGAVTWSPGGELPPTLGATGAPLIYATLGSSGNLSVIPALLSAVRDLPLELVLSTAGRVEPRDLPPNVSVASFVPGELAARAARFVITNGGSSTGYQALMEGRPVLGIPCNMDQYLAMAAIENASAGLSVRSGSASPKALRAAILRLLEAEELFAGARRLQSTFARWDSQRSFEQFLHEALSSATGIDISKEVHHA
jgi:UDP:flavonoid glycosyltransferase YjiC (YdhE family)